MIPLISKLLLTKRLKNVDIILTLIWYMFGNIHLLKDSSSKLSNSYIDGWLARPQKQLLLHMVLVAGVEACKAYLTSVDMFVVVSVYSFFFATYYFWMNRRWKKNETTRDLKWKYVNHEKEKLRQRYLKLMNKRKDRYI